LIVDHALVEHVFARTDDVEDDERRLALRHCVAELNERQRDLLRARYADGASLAKIACQTKKTEPAVKMALHRIRTALMACVQRRLAKTQ
jgi:RNA polymerase sigma factor (sigma-70 family)